MLELLIQSSNINVHFQNFCPISQVTFQLWQRFTYILYFHTLVTRYKDYDMQNHYFLSGTECCPLSANKEAPRQKSQIYNLLPTLFAKLLKRPLGLKTVMKDKDKTSTISRVVIDVHTMVLGRPGDYH